MCIVINYLLLFVVETLSKFIKVLNFMEVMTLKLKIIQKITNLISTFYSLRLYYVHLQNYIYVV